MADDQDEKTEEATQSRRDDFRKRGQVAQTRELGAVLTLLASALMFWGLGRFFMQQFSEIITESLGPFLIEAARHGDYLPATIFVVKKGLLIATPVLAMLAVMSVASTVVQVGLLHNEDALEFDLEKINPMAGLKKMFSLRSVIEGAKSIVKLALVIAIVAVMLKDHVAKIPLIISFPVNQVMAFAGDIVVRLLASIGVFMGVLAAADYFFQKFELDKQMRMTKQEVKEEHKSREGDPMVKARIRRIQREMANKRMMSEVPKADVIITNPTHIACALKYDPATMAAPVLLAKGAEVTAEKIKEIARAHNIPIMENKPLARTIFKTMKVGRVIPRELFTAVAQVLSYVYKLRKKAKR